jgi:hypothetical protein
MTRIEQTATAFLVASLGAAQKHTLQLFNSIEKGRFRVATAYLKGEEHVLPQITPDCASQEWCAHFRRGWDVRRLNRLSKWLRSFDREVLVPIRCSIATWQGCWRGCEYRSSKSSTHGTGAHENRKMRLIYRDFFNVSDRIKYVSEA